MIRARRRMASLSLSSPIPGECLYRWYRMSLEFALEDGGFDWGVEKFRDFVRDKWSDADADADVDAIFNELTLLQRIIVEKPKNNLELLF